MVAELKREACEKHLLYNQPLTVVARRMDCDDVLFKFGAPSEKFAVVHLTYRREVEVNPTFPRTRVYSTFEDFAENKMKIDALGYSN